MQICKVIYFFSHKEILILYVLLAIFRTIMSIFFFNRLCFSVNVKTCPSGDIISPGISLPFLSCVHAVCLICPFYMPYNFIHLMFLYCKCFFVLVFYIFFFHPLYFFLFFVVVVVVFHCCPNYITWRECVHLLELPFSFLYL